MSLPQRTPIFFERVCQRFYSPSAYTLSRMDPRVFMQHHLPSVFNKESTEHFYWEFRFIRLDKATTLDEFRKYFKGPFSVRESNDHFRGTSFAFLARLPSFRRNGGFNGVNIKLRERSIIDYYLTRSSRRQLKFFQFNHNSAKRRVPLNTTINSSSISKFCDAILSRRIDSVSNGVSFKSSRR